MRKYIFLILVGYLCWSAQSIAQVKSLQVVQEEQIDLAPGKVLIDADDNVVGHEKNLKRAGQFIGTYQSQLSVEGWPEVTIDRYLNLIVDKKNKRLITYGYPPSNDVASQEVNLAIYDSGGQLLFQKDNVLSSFKIPIRISNSGAIYIGGWNTQLEQVVHKYDKNGNLEWEVKLPFQLMVSAIDLSVSNESLVVLQNNNSLGSIKSSAINSALLLLDSAGNTKRQWESKDNFHMLKHLANDNVLISNGYHLVLKETSTFDSIGEDQFTTEGIVKLKTKSNKESFSFLTKKNNLYQYGLVGERLVEQKKFDLSSINISSFEVDFIDVDQDNEIRLSTKKSKFTLQ